MLKLFFFFYQVDYSSSLGGPTQEGHCYMRHKGTQSPPWHAKIGVCKVGNLLPQRLQNPVLRADGAHPIPMKPSNRVKSAGQAADRPSHQWCDLSFSTSFREAAAMTASLWAQRVLREKEAPSNVHFIPPPSIPSDRISSFVCFIHCIYELE